jgi:anti-sigma factor ChrR (cupin superfamily)
MSEALHFPDFLQTALITAEFKPFREGVEIAKLYDGPPDVALLRYAPGASVPAHFHRGLESILVLSGSQSDERGTYRTGALVLNPAGTSHRVWSEEGCVVLIQWTLPVEFLTPEQETP